jgi:hypothetical protein
MKKIRKDYQKKRNPLASSNLLGKNNYSNKLFRYSSVTVLIYPHSLLLGDGKLERRREG